MGNLPRIPPPIKSISFNASWVEKGSYGLVKNREVVFALGLGPCGRVVTHLAYEVSGEVLTIRQTSFPPELAEWRGNAERAFRASLPQDTVTGGEYIPISTCFFGAFKRSFIQAPVEIQKAEVSESSKKILEDFKKYDQARKDACEIKTFIYKLTDVRGRIVTEQ